MKRFIQALFLSLLCVYGAAAQVALHGLFTPVNLKNDTTEIFIRDYLASEAIDAVKLPSGLTNHSQEKAVLRLTGTLKSKMAILEVESQGEQFDLLLIAPSAKPVSLTIPRSAFKKKYRELRVIGSFNNWNRASKPLRLERKTYQLDLSLEPGRYEYKFYADGEEILDPTNSAKVPNGMGSFNNILNVTGDSIVPDEYYLSTDASAVNIHFREGGAQTLVFWNNQALMVPCKKSYPPTCPIRIPEQAKELERSYLRIFTFAGSVKGRDQLIPLHYGQPVSNPEQLSRSDWHQARLYFLMVDRFNDGDPNNNEPVADSSIQPQANYLGGDLQGVNDKIKSGYFDSLGVNTIWLSPITQNPKDAWGYWDKGQVKSKFSGYHGYWPVSNTRIDYRFGNDQDLTQLLDFAHQDQKNVLLDYVANHVHLQHPVYQNNKDWATPLYLPDGTKNTEKWDEHRLTTWFDDHLPTLDLRRYDIVDPMVDSAMIWLTQYNFDGFRHDATKHIDELYWRTLTYRIRQQTDQPIYQIGETYGSPQLINSYISTGMLDAQFDFNLYDAAVNSFAKSEGLQNLVEVLTAGLETYGYHHLMGNISGNQDRSRFISLASGEVKFDEDQKLAGWDREIGKPKAKAYRRLALLHAFNNAVPGIPCVYYGDEIGMPGANDPDNRRMMYFTGWDTDEQNLYRQVQEIHRLRAEHLALIYGSTEVRLLGPKLLLIKRRYFDQTVLVLFNLSNRSMQPELSENMEEFQMLYRSPQAEDAADEVPADSPSGINIAPLSFLFLANY
jgi:glycosidase